MFQSFFPCMITRSRVVVVQRCIPLCIFWCVNFWGRCDENCGGVETNETSPLSDEKKRTKMIMTKMMIIIILFIRKNFLFFFIYFFLLLLLLRGVLISPFLHSFHTTPYTVMASSPQKAIQMSVRSIEGEKMHKS